MDSDIRQIIAAARDLVRRCDQGRAAWLRQLAQPLPPMLREDAAQALHEIHELTRFDPFDGLRQQLPFSEAEQDPRPGQAQHRRSGITPSASGDRLRSVVPFDPRQPTATRAGWGETAAAAPSDSAIPAPTGQQKSLVRQQTTTAHAADSAATIHATALRRTAKRIAASADSKAVSNDSSVDGRTTHQVRDTDRTSAVSKSARPRSAAELIASKRKQRAKARHLAATSPAAVKQRPEEKLPAAIGSASPPLTDTGPGLGAALLAEAVAGSSRRAPTAATTTAAAPSPGERAGRAGYSSMGSSQSTRTRGPVGIGEIDAEIEPSPTPPRAPTPAPSSEDLARLLTDAAYLQGIDLT